MKSAGRTDEGRSRCAALRLRRHPVGMLSLAYQGVTGRYRAHGDPAAADCVVALSFGFRTGLDGRVRPGGSNRELARILDGRFPGKPIIAQFEVDDALYELTRQRAAYRIGGPREGAYLDTWEVALRAARIMRDERLGDTAVVVAHSHHLPRAEAVLRAAGVRTVVPAGLKATWDGRSEQPWTRNPVSWAAREIGAIGAYAARGRLATRTAP